MDPLETNFGEIYFKIFIIIFINKNMHLKLLSAKGWPFSNGLILLTKLHSIMISFNWAQHEEIKTSKSNISYDLKNL